MVTNQSLTQTLDAAVVLGMILLNEAQNIKGDAGKKRSKFIVANYIHIFKTTKDHLKIANLLRYITPTPQSMVAVRDFSSDIWG